MKSVEKYALGERRGMEEPLILPGLDLELWAAYGPPGLDLELQVLLVFPMRKI